MKELDLEMQRLSMADSDEYDEYEEEVIDRDEEYDVDDDEEEYDDEEYDDDYDEEEYDDEYEDDYDDGYDDNYYDERLNKVLDELAELKRAVANPPAVQNNQPTYSQPSIPYVYAGNLPQNQPQGNNGEVLMYNEISRLRDELSKTQNSQNLHVELNRLKDEMERERKYNESQYLAEIKRLNEKIETLQKNSLGPQSEDDGYLPESALGGGHVDNGSVNKLIEINESILKSSRSVDSRMRNELSDIKKRLEALDTNEISGLISAVKALPAGGIGSTDMTALTNEIVSLKESLSVNGTSVRGDDFSSAVSAARLAELKEAASSFDTDAVILMKSIGELSCAIGLGDEKETEKKKSALALMDEFVRFREQSLEMSFGEILSELNDIGARISALDSAEAVVLADACDRFADKVLKTPLDKKSADELVHFADDTAVFSISREKREALDKFVVLSQRVVKAERDEIKEILPQIVEAKSKLESSAKQAADTAIIAKINEAIALGKDDELKELVTELCTLRASDFVKFPRVAVVVASTEEKSVSTLIEKMDGLLAALGDGAIHSIDNNVQAGDSLADVKAEIVNLCTTKQLEDAIVEIKRQYAELLNAIASVSGGVIEPVSVENAEAQYTNNELSDQIYNIRDELNKAIHDENLLTQDTVELKLSDIADAQTASHRQILDDVKTIKNSVLELHDLIESMPSVGATVSRVDENVDGDENIENSNSTGKISDEIYDQFDKLYEDVSTLLASTENNVVERIGETVGSTMDNVNNIIDSINANIDNINALVTGVNTSLDGINSNFEQTNNNIGSLNTELANDMAKLSVTLDEVRDYVSLVAASDASTLILEKADELKLAVDDFIVKSGANDDAALNDRLQLVSDVAFLREREEARAASSENDVAGANIAAELAELRDNLTRDLNVLTDTVSGLNIDEMRENIVAIHDTLDILAADTSIGTMGEDVAAIKEGQSLILDSLSNSTVAQEEFKNSIVEDLSFIRSKFETEEAEGAPEVTVSDVYDTLTIVNDKLDLISNGEQSDMDTLVAHLEEIKEQLHLKELEPSIEGITDNEAEKQSLLNEIAEVRERLSALEEASQVQSDTALTQLGMIGDEIAVVKEAVASSRDSVETVDYEAMLVPITEDLAQIKQVLTENAEDVESDSSIADIIQTVNDMSDRVSDIAERMEIASLSLDSIPLLLSELAEVKSALTELKENAFTEDSHSESILADDPDDIARRLDILDDKTNEIIERSETAIVDESLRDEIAEIKDNLFADYERIKEDISYIRNQIELNVDEPESDETAFATNDEDIGTILEDLAEIKEKLSTGEEYDVMAEILSLREDLKASRASETGADDIENIRREIAEKNAAILGELENLRGEIVTISSARETDEASEGLPTDGELNMILSEIVSLRDELQSYKDELNSHLVSHDDGNEEVEEFAVGEGDVRVNENLDVILDELTGIRSELVGFKDESHERQNEEIEPLKVSIDELHDGLAELKDMISRRVTIAESSENVSDAGTNVAGLDVVLNELANFKKDIAEEISSIHETLDANADRGGDEVDYSEDRLVAIEDGIAALGDKLAEIGNGEIISDERLEAIVSEMEALKKQQSGAVEPDETFDVLSEMLLLHNEMSDIKTLLQTRSEESDADIPAPNFEEEIVELRDMVESLTVSTDYSRVLEELSTIREQLSSSVADVTDGETEDYSTDLIESESSELKEELASIKELLMQQRAFGENNELSALRDEIVSLKEQLVAPTALNVEANEPDMGVMTEVMALRDEIASLKEQLVAPTVSNVEANEPDMGVMAEVMALRDEIAALKEQLASATVAASGDQPAEADMTVLTEIMALREEMNALRETLAMPDTGLTETVEQIREDVRLMKDEPDLSALNEVLALRDEFQAMKDEMASKKSAEANEKSNEEILSEVQQLRDQMFAISMANVNDGSTDKVTYESYNNIILDEITALREELNAYKANDVSQPIMDEIAEIKNSIAAQSVDDGEIMSQIAKLKSDLQTMRNSEEADATNNAILAQLETLKTELANQREADLTSLNFMSEMARLIERQNQYINQNSNTKITDEIESLKAEIASSLAAPSVETSAIMNEIAQLKDEISRGSGKEIDNKTILDELAKLKDEISAEKPSGQNTVVLEEIARLKDEIVALTEKNVDSGKDSEAEEISKSINDLKNELTQIADIVSDTEKVARPKSTTKKSSSRSSSSKSASTKRSRSKTSTSKSKKTSTRKKATTTEQIGSRVSSDELLSKIDATTFEIPMGGEEYSLNPVAVEHRADDDMDLASKLAKQVANKLIMEQLVVQLGDGGVPENEVDEIVRDILPTEFNTVMIEEQSDQVRRLANSLVLDKLRARLRGGNDDDNNNN